jgi:hypothetical protein
MRQLPAVLKGLSATLVVVVVAATPAGASAAVQDGDVFHPAARFLKPQHTVQQRIDSAGEHDWYAFSGIKSDFVVVVGHIEASVMDPVFDIDTPVSCPGTWPLRVTLYDPDGIPMRTVHGTNWATNFQGPQLPGRYVLLVRTADPGCVGYRYELSVEVEDNGPWGATEDSVTAEDIAQVSCEVKTYRLVRIQREARRQRRLIRQTHGAARARHQRARRRCLHVLPGLRAAKQRACGRA